MVLAPSRPLIEPDVLFPPAHVAPVFYCRLLSPPPPLALFSPLFASELWATTIIFPDCGCYLGLMKAMHKGRASKNDGNREKMKSRMELIYSNYYLRNKEVSRILKIMLRNLWALNFYFYER